MSQLNEKAFLEYILDQLNDAVQVTNKAGELIYINQRACQQIGLSKKELLHQKIQNIEPDFQQDNAWEHFVDEVKKKGFILRESQSTRPDGSRFRIESSVRYFRMNGTGYIISVIRDISARKREQQFFKKILDELPLSITVTSRDGNHYFQNHFNALHASGNHLSTLQDLSAFELITPDKSITKEETFTDSDGNEQWFETTHKAFSDETVEQGFLTIKVDITQRKQDAEELLKAKKAKEQFLANMSHEIRTPVNGITGMLNLMLDTPLSAEQKKYLTSVNEATRNLRAIIDDILDISAIESGKLTMERISFRPDYQIQSAINSFRLQAEEKGLVLRHTLGTDAETIVVGDPLRLNQILLNLIGNALKFTYEGEITVSANVRQKSANEVWIDYSVSDTGIGIAKEKLSVIFDSFQQAEESTSRQFGGTGLGLAICKQLTELQGGTIKVQSKLETGTTFLVSIPYPLSQKIDLKPHHLKRQKEDHTIRFKALAGIRILLVEDNNINSIYAKNILKKLKCQVDHAENGLIALEKIRKNTYDAILMDVQMPVMDGFETTQTLRAKFSPPKSKIPVIALTANAILGDRERCLEMGMDHYIVKPFEPEQLYEILSECLPDQKNIQSIANSKEIENMNREVSSPHSSDSKSVLDLDFLTSICDGDQEFMDTMIKGFIEDVPPSLGNLKQFIAEARWLDASKAAHQLKPSMQFMGLHETLENVRFIEISCKEEKHLSELSSMVLAVEKIVDAAIKELKAIDNS
uniref:histidine kinase n=1 Tax=Roseihalotalea indica TaxID=2867963 RepID=A0AA49GML0_9BACT|nr:ATP-binding protein [Tunicatimonas sp. TK19036]